MLLLAAAACLAAPARAADAPYQEAGRRKPWFSLMRPARDTPAAQLAYARALRDSGHWIRASRHYRALVASWPAAPEAPVAQYEAARLLDHRGRYDAAFAQYQVLLDRYPGDTAFDEVVGRQFAIAKAAMNTRRYRLLLGGFRTPGHAIPYLGHVVTNAPQLEAAAEAQYLIGRIQADAGNLEQAEQAFETVQFRFPGSPFAADAAFGRAETLYRLSRKSPEDDPLAAEAWAALDRYVQQHPETAGHGRARAWRDEIHARRAHRAFDRAAFYERTARKPAAALEAYRLFVRRFPRSEWTPGAERRIQELQQTLGDIEHDEPNPEDASPAGEPDRPLGRD